MEKRTNFSVPFNGDITLLDNIPRDFIKELYGCLTDSPIGAGRSRKRLIEVKEDSLKTAVTWIKKQGGEFNYLINAPYYDEKILYSHGIFEDFIEYLRALNINKFTVTLPQLVIKIKKIIPNAEICVSQFGNVSSVPAAKYWKEIGVHEICIGNDIIRNLNLIKKILHIGIKLKTVVNNCCIMGCPLKFYHGTFESFHSTNYNYEGYNDFCTLLCKKILLEKKINVLCANFIRPEDIFIYEEAGIECFKLVDRNKPTAWILNVIKAYDERRYDGNLVDILGLFNPKKSEYLKNESARGEMISEEFDINIDNNELSNGFQSILTRCNGTSCFREQVECLELAERAINYGKNHFIELEIFNDKINKLLE